MLAPAVDIAIVDVFRLKFFFHERNEAFGIFLAQNQRVFYLLYKPLMFLRIYVRERKIFKLSFYFSDAKAIRERCIQLERFKSYAFLLFRRKRGKSFHVVAPVNEFYQNDADVFGNGKKHLPEIFGLAFGH